MSVILKAAELQGKARVERRATATNEKGDKVHLWELDSGGVIMLRHKKGEGFTDAVKLETKMELIVERFRQKRGQKLFTHHNI